MDRGEQDEQAERAISSLQSRLSEEGYLPTPTEILDLVWSYRSVAGQDDALPAAIDESEPLITNLPFSNRKELPKEKRDDNATLNAFSNNNHEMIFHFDDWLDHGNESTSLFCYPVRRRHDYQA